jgi:hypothetical protein
MDATKSVTANFTLMPMLTVATSGTGGGTVTSSPAGISCGADCSEAYNPNTVVTLTATPPANSVFSSWSGACAGQGNPCAITMDSIKTATAVFAVASSPSNTSSSGGGGGCTLGAGGKFDPVLPGLFLLATMVLWRRRRA